MNKEPPVYKFVLVRAWAQCGEKPPYNLLSLRVRTKGETPQVFLHRRWVDFPKDGPRPVLDRFHGMPCAGIASDWRPA